MQRVLGRIAVLTAGVGALALAIPAAEGAEGHDHHGHHGRVIELEVTKKGFEPTPIEVKKGQPLKLKITRRTDRTCAKEIVIPGYDISKDLPLNQTVTVEFTPAKSGKLKYGCAMNQMIGGVLVVQ